VDLPSPGRRAWRLLPIVIAVAVPWAWFAVRDIGGPLDVVAVGLPLIGATAIVSSAVVAVIVGRAWPVVAGASVLAVCSVSVIGPRLPEAAARPDPGIRMLMANVWENNPTLDEVAPSMLARGADLVIAAEMPDDAFYERMTEAAAAAGLDVPDATARRLRAAARPPDARRRRRTGHAVRALHRACPEPAA
jgi:4-amino-4-deoxy-L-arabinose transferase-like glycosyltransferase